jgi:hypothetical protein
LERDGQPARLIERLINHVQVVQEALRDFDAFAVESGGEKVTAETHQVLALQLAFAKTVNQVVFDNAHALTEILVRFAQGVEALNLAFRQLA